MMLIDVPAQMFLLGPTLPTWALQQVGSYLGYTGRDPNVVAKAALDPWRRFATDNWCIAKGSFAFDVGCLGQRRRRGSCRQPQPARRERYRHRQHSGRADGKTIAIAPRVDSQCCSVWRCRGYVSGELLPIGSPIRN